MSNETQRMIDGIKSELDGLSARIAVDDEAMGHMHRLYLMIWPEACYDPLNESTERFARKLLPHIQALNEKFKFKK